MWTATIGVVDGTKGWGKARMMAEYSERWWLLNVELTVDILDMACRAW